MEYHCFDFWDYDIFFAMFQRSHKVIIHLEFPRNVKWNSFQGIIYFLNLYIHVDCERLLVNKFKNQGFVQNNGIQLHFYKLLKFWRRALHRKFNISLSTSNWYRIVNSNSTLYHTLDALNHFQMPMFKMNWRKICIEIFIVNYIPPICQVLENFKIFEIKSQVLPICNKNSLS